MTEVQYETSIDPGFPIPGFLKRQGEKQIVKGALQDLKKRVEFASVRIILFTGKGGVGKTTVASATALRIAAAGKKTLLMSTDPAHSVADAFGVELSPEPTEVAPNLWAEQIDPQRRLEDNWREIQQHAIAILNWAGLAEIEAEELSVIPGLDELFALADVKRHHDDDPYDALVVDCAPTGETLRLAVATGHHPVVHGAHLSGRAAHDGRAPSGRATHH